MTSDDAAARRPPRRLVLGAGALAAGLAAAEALRAPAAGAAPATAPTDDVDGFSFVLDPATRLASVRKDGAETSALFLATALGAGQGPRWTTDRILPPVTPGFAQWTAEPALDTALAWLGDSTGELNRTVFQFAAEYARRNPGIRVVLDKMNLGGGGNVVADPSANPPVVPSAKPTPTFAVFKEDDTTGAYSRTWNTRTWAQNGGEDQHQPVPGLPGYTLRLPACARFTPWGANALGSGLTRGFVGADVQPTTWLPGANMVLLAQDDATAARGRGTVLRIRPDGRVELRGSTTGVATDPGWSAVSSASVTTVRGYAPGARIAVGVRFDLDTGGRSVFTPLYRIGGHGARWLPLGTPQSVAGVNAWYGAETVPWEFGAGTTFRGDWFEAVVRVTDENGPDLVPRLPQMWEYAVDSMKGTLRGGRTLWIENFSWPQHGLEDFADRTDIGKPGDPVFTRTWNRAAPTVDNVYSVMDMLPLLPYGVTVWNSNHNEIDTGTRTLRLWRRAHNALVLRSPGADHCVLVQNPTLRMDANTAESPPGSGRRVFDQQYLVGFRRAHDFRIAQAGSIARLLGCAVLDGRSDMVDHVRNGGTLRDLVQVGGEQLHPTATGAKVLALGLLNQLTRTEFGTVGVLP